MALLGTLLVNPAIRAEEAAAPEASAFGAPTAPRNVTAEVTEQGLRVSWTGGGLSRPRPTHAIVDAGPGSCPVTVSAERRSVILPIPEGLRRVTPRVRTVNALGMSEPVAAERPVRVEDLGSSRVQPVQILSITDLHGALEADSRSIGAARLASAFDRDRRVVPATVTVSSGDNFGNSPLISELFEEYPTIEALNMMGLDVSTFGNHEHDRPLDHVRAMVEASDFTWTVANYSDLSPVSGETKAVEPYVLLERAGVTLGIVGMNRARTVDSVPPANFWYGDGETLTISPFTFEVSREARRAREAGADIVILLIHDGWSKNVGRRATGPMLTIAQRVQGDFDVIYGGHTHQEFTAMLGDTLIVQTPAYGQMYARTGICVDVARGRVLGAVNENVTRPMLRGVAPDADISAMVAGYAERRDRELTRVVGSVAQIQEHGGDPAIERTGDFPLGNFVADLVRAEYGTDIALLNAGIFRDTLPASTFTPADPTVQRPVDGVSGPFDVTLGDLTTAFRASKNVVTTSITGLKLWRAIERALIDYPRNSDFLQVSGLRIEFDPARPARDRVTGVWDASGNPIVPDDRTYSVATLGYMVYGKFRYARLFERQGATVHRPYLASVIDRFASDRSQGRVTAIAAADGRIRVVESQDDSTATATSASMTVSTARTRVDSRTAR